MFRVFLLTLLVISVLQTTFSWYVTVAEKTSPRSRLASLIRPTSSWRNLNDYSTSACSPSDFSPSSLFPNQRLIREFFEDIENTFENTKSYGRRIPLDIKETNENYEIIADVPGVAKEDIKLSVKDNVLTISTERKQYEKNENESFRREERFVGVSQRSISLPENADEENIKAKYENGVLQLTIPKVPASPKNEPKTIAIE